MKSISLAACICLLYLTPFAAQAASKDTSFRDPVGNRVQQIQLDIDAPIAKVWWGPNYNPGFVLPWMRPEDHEHVLEGFRKAGWEGLSQ